MFLQLLTLSDDSLLEGDEDTTPIALSGSSVCLECDSNGAVMDEPVRLLGKTPLPQGGRCGCA